MAKPDVKDFEKALSDEERIQLWLNKNWKKCLIAVIVIAIAVVAFMSVNYIRDQRIMKAVNAIAEAKADELPALIAENPDVPGANLARLRIALNLMDKKDYAGAESMFTKFASDTTVPLELRTRARFSAAACKEYAGKAKEASAAYMMIFNDSTVSGGSRYEAAYQAGRILIALNDLAAAKKLLQPVAESKPLAGQPLDTASLLWQNYVVNLYNSIK